MDKIWRPRSGHVKQCYYYEYTLTHVVLQPLFCTSYACAKNVSNTLATSALRVQVARGGKNYENELTAKNWRSSLGHEPSAKFNKINFHCGPKGTSQGPRSTANFTGQLGLLLVQVHSAEAWTCWPKNKTEVLVLMFFVSKILPWRPVVLMDLGPFWYIVCQLVDLPRIEIC